MNLTDAIRNTQPFGPVVVSIVFDRGTVCVIVTQGTASLKWETHRQEGRLLFARRDNDLVGKAVVRILRDLTARKAKARAKAARR